MTKFHAFEPSVIQVRTEDGVQIKRSRCRVCHRWGHEQSRVHRGRTVVFWRHLSRPAQEPQATGEACAYMGAGRTWCCKADGHDGGHHIHRGPRRSVHDA